MLRTTTPSAPNSSNLTPVDGLSTVSPPLDTMLRFDSGTSSVNDSLAVPSLPAPIVVSHGHGHVGPITPHEPVRAMTPEVAWPRVDFSTSSGGGAGAAGGVGSAAGVGVGNGTAGTGISFLGTTTGLDSASGSVQGEVEGPDANNTGDTAWDVFGSAQWMGSVLRAHDPKRE